MVKGFSRHVLNSLEAVENTSITASFLASERLFFCRLQPAHFGPPPGIG